LTPQRIIVDLIIHLLETIDRDPSIAPAFSRLSNKKDVWRHLLFCILSSQVKTSSAVRATHRVLSEVPFFDEKIATSDVYDRAKNILGREHVRYRFPDHRSRNIAHSWFAFAQMEHDLYNYLESFNNEAAAREWITQLFPGLGLKQASMFLRDIGYSFRLCIVDTHILWYCSCLGHPSERPITRKKYVEVEDFVLRQSDNLGVSPNVFDTVVWVAVKTFKANQCSMQFA
jgi:N-glycosylase/DNA lyase